MALRLKEDPREWRKFAAVGSLFVLAIACAVHWRGRVSQAGFIAIAAATIIAFGLGWFRPRWVRPVYRAAMRVSHWVGQYVGWVLLALFFLLILTPVGVVLRLVGKDPLDIRGPFPAKTSSWRPVRGESSLDRLF